MNGWVPYILENIISFSYFYVKERVWILSWEKDIFVWNLISIFFKKKSVLETMFPYKPCPFRSLFSLSLKQRWLAIMLVKNALAEMTEVNAIFKLCLPEKDTCEMQKSFLF